MAKISNFIDAADQVHYQAALRVAGILNRHGFEAYLIGGAVRDILLGVLPKDFDIVTNAEPAQITALPELARAKYDDPAQAFGVTRVVVDVNMRGEIHKGGVEVATYRRDIEAHLGRRATRVEFATLEEDVERRDLTINALALDLANDFLVDLVGGLDDIEAKIIRFIGEPLVRIKEDPLRILRAIRLKNQLGFNYEPATAEAIKEAVVAGYIGKIATERLQAELSLMLIDPHRRSSIEDLDNFGVIDVVLPELGATRGVPQPPEFHSEGDVWTHSLLALDSLTAKPSRRLAWALLLHDIGKPPTFKPAIETGDRIRFNRHYEVGSELTANILNRLRLPKSEIDDIVWMIRFHMGIDDLPKMRPARQREFLAHPAFADLLELHRADAKASIHSRRGRIDISPPAFPELEALWSAHQQEAKAPSLKADLGIDGGWIKTEFKLSDGPKIGQVLKQLEDAYLDGEIRTKLDAQKLAAKLLNKS